MGFRFNKPSSWRTPLQIIDCLLPPQEAVQHAPPLVTHCLRSFQRAGWLGKARSKAGGMPAAPIDGPGKRTATNRCNDALAPLPVRVIHTPEQPIVLPRRPGARVVISGRMADVCAELERLAAMEARTSRA